LRQRARSKPGPKGPSAELIRAVMEMKQRNPSWGCPRIAQQIALAFGILINKDVVRRILAGHYRPNPFRGRTFLAHILGAYEGQPLEHRSLSMRISRAKDLLGAGCHGSVHKADCWIRNSCRNRERLGRLSHVQSGKSRTAPSKVFKLRSRSLIPISSMASQSSSARRRGSQNCAVRAAVASFCRAIDRNDSA
jgi:hypothetical protein